MTGSSNPPFTRLEAVAAPLAARNIDTDRIIPARFLKRQRKDGLADCAFYDMRFERDGRLRPDFVLNRPPFDEARILVTGANFGCGSSREGAVYALWDLGIRAVVAESFGEIFKANALKNGLLPVELAGADVDLILRDLEAGTIVRITVDLERQQVLLADGPPLAFSIDAFARECLLRGTDELGYTLSQLGRIDAFEASMRNDPRRAGASRDRQEQARHGNE